MISKNIIIIMCIGICFAMSYLFARHYRKYPDRNFYGKYLTNTASFWFLTIVATVGLSYLLIKLII
ncbi:hypothetical protein [Furfurilactobacillus siliginis]|uniref:Uncharacterized protein n=1 Tax=Furfurilactobacillus siliginis TaxID=348151 RepID=A0A0R2L755_9LACO|nr:hypothetical protein [Furfurilactobacillus siliginis]KRN94717.1 hypothetical protein IV55_GL000488 [Furfurilactobacillus siliginis]GEK29484.1 hypothetical protein LSI01_17950 [Furfurilactobacillus siliginis]